MGPPSRGMGALQALHETSGTRVLPARVETSSFASPAFAASQRSVPHRANPPASRTLASNFPALLRALERRKTFDGFAVATSVSLPEAISAVACPAEGSRIFRETPSPSMRQTAP